MLRNILLLAANSKNILMLITAAIYVLALFSTLSGHILLFSSILLFVVLILLVTELFPVKYILIWTIIFYIGIINTSVRIKATDNLLNLAPVNSQITGQVISIPQGKTEGKLKFFFKVDNIKFGSEGKNFRKEKALVVLNSDFENQYDIKLYQYATLTGRLSVPFKAGNPSQFDYGDYLRNYGTYAVFYAKTAEKVDKSLSVKAKLMQSVSNYREDIIKIHSKYLPSPNLEILGGIVFGDDAVSPPKDIKQSFVNSGLLHILAASGMNVAFIYGFFFILMSLFRIPFKLRVSTGMVMVVIYSLMTGLGASVIRATCMLLFVLAGKLIDRDAHSISLLSFVALLMLLYNPMWVNDVGFQLSFIVTFGILVMAPAFGRFKNKITNFLLSTVAIPIIAQLWVIPIQIFYFNNISIYSVFANIMSVPILMILSFGGFVSSLLSVIKPIADFVCMVFDFVLNHLISLLVNISDFWGTRPCASLQTTHPSVLQIVLYYGILLCISGLLYKEFREKYLKRILSSVLALLIILLFTLIPIKDKDLEITTFDVGNADCFLIKTPDNEYIMIDTGKLGYNGGKSQAEIIVLKYLKDIGVKEIDKIIVTHFDNDHCGGATDLLKSLKVKEIYLNDLKHNSNAAQNIYKTAKEYNTKMVLALNKQEIYNKNGLKVTNYIDIKGKDDNENSIITLVKYKDFTMLFTGDASVNSLRNMKKEIPQNITVLKVPHHGAVGGIEKDIMEYLNPKYSVISVGENKFGHPSAYTLRLLENSHILRTDINNSIRFKVDIKGVLKTYLYDNKKRNYAPAI